MAHRLPPEIVGKIICKTRLQYNKKRFDQCGFDEGVKGYADMCLKQEEALWDSTVDWIQAVLENVKTVIQRVDGHPNRWGMYDGSPMHNVPDKLLACWPRYWYCDEGFDEDDLEFTLTEEICREIAGENEYCFQAVSDWKQQMVVFRDEQIHPLLKAARLKFVEEYTVHNEYYDNPPDVLERSLHIHLEFNVGDVYKIELSTERDEEPEFFVIGIRKGKDKQDQERNLDHMLTFLRRLVVRMGAPYLVIKPTWYKKEFRAFGFRQLGFRC